MLTNYKLPFTFDMERLNKPSDLVRQMSMRWVAPLYEALEAIRLSRDNDLLAQQDTSLSETR